MMKEEVGMTEDVVAGGQRPFLGKFSNTFSSWVYMEPDI